MRAGNTVQLNASIPAELMLKLQEMAKKDNRSLSNLVSNILKNATENNNGKLKTGINTF